MACHRCLRATRNDAESTAGASGGNGCAEHLPTALETLRQAVHARSIQSAHAASEESAESPIRGAWIIG